MEEGQKVSISLTSELDVKSSDMLVPVSGPKFAHNRQRYQGHTLPTTLRYEHDGWAAGNEVYEFKYVPEPVETTPKGLVIYRLRYNENPNYKLIITDGEFYDSDIYINYNKESKIRKVSFGDMPTIETNNNITTIKGKIKDNNYELAYDANTGNLIATPQNKISATIKHRDDFMSEIEVSDLTTKIECTEELFAPKDVYNGEYLVAEYVNFKNGIHTWQTKETVIKYNATANELIVKDQQSEAKFTTTAINHALTFKYNKMFSMNTTLKLSYVSCIDELQKPALDLSNTKIVLDSLSEQTTQYYSEVTLHEDLADKQYTYLDTILPVWASVFAIAHNEADVVRKEQRHRVPYTVIKKMPIYLVNNSMADLNELMPKINEIDVEYLIVDDINSDNIKVTDSICKTGITDICYYYQGNDLSDYNTVYGRNNNNFKYAIEDLGIPDSEKWTKVNNTLSHASSLYRFNKSSSAHAVEHYFNFDDTYIEVKQRVELINIAININVVKTSGEKVIFSFFDYPTLQELISAFSEFLVDESKGKVSFGMPTQNITLRADSEKVTVAHIGFRGSDSLLLGYITAAIDSKQNVVVQDDKNLDLSKGTYISKQNIITSDLPNASFAGLFFTTAGHIRSRIEIDKAKLKTKSFAEDLTDCVSIEPDNRAFINDANSQILIDRNTKLLSHVDTVVPIDIGEFTVNHNKMTSHRSWNGDPALPTRPEKGNTILIETSIGAELIITKVISKDTKTLQAGNGMYTWYEYTLDLDTNIDNKLVNIKMYLGSELHVITDYIKTALFTLDIKSMYYTNGLYTIELYPKTLTDWQSKEGTYYKSMPQKIYYNKGQQNVNQTITDKTINTNIGIPITYLQRVKDANLQQTHIGGIFTYKDEIYGCVDINLNALNAAVCDKSFTKFNYMKLIGTAVISNVYNINEAPIIVNSTNKLYKTHDFINDQLPSLLEQQEVTVTAQRKDIDGKAYQDILYTIGDVYIKLRYYNILDKFDVLSSSEGTVKIQCDDINSDVNNIIFVQTKQLQYNCTAALPYTVNGTLQEYTKDYFKVIDSYSNNSFIYDFLLEYGTLRMILDNNELQAIRHGEVLPAYRSDNRLEKYDIAFTYAYIIDILAIIKGVTASKNLSSVKFSDSFISFENKGTEYKIDLEELFSDKKNSKVLYLSSDINESGSKQKQIQLIESESEFQILKQAWDTQADTEAFWWVDKDHYLTTTDEYFTLYEKQDIIDDWNADQWKAVGKWKESDYVSQNTLKVFCTNNYYKDSAKLCTISCTDIDTVTIKLYRLNKEDTFLSENKLVLSIVNRPIGEILNDDDNKDKLFTYKNITARTLITNSDITATCINDFVILGIHYDNNFCQWAIVFKMSTHQVMNITQGYGYVGVDGSLTGGELPSKYFKVGKGFTSIVQPLSVLDTSIDKESNSINTLNELNTIKAMVVGDAGQQWYIDKEIDSIISHCTFNKDTGEFEVVKLTINNNYSVTYNSASFISRVLGDYLPVLKPLARLLDELKDDDSHENKTFNNLWKTFWSFAGYPMLCYVSPKISTMNYLQQTLGQYAYVHKNSTIQHEKETKTESIKNNIDDLDEISAIITDELSFDLQNVKQKLSCDDNIYNAALMLIMSFGTSALDFTTEKVRVNAKLNQSTDKDKGKQFSQMFLQNMANISNSDMTINSMSPTQTSEVSAIKTLDMFYSTSDQQKVYAGSGFVNHNFVAQCMAQSVTSAQLEMNQIKSLFLIKAITQWDLELKVAIEEAALEIIQEQIEAQGGGGTVAGAFFGLSSGAFASLGAVAALGLALGEIVMREKLRGTKLAQQLLPPMLDSLGADSLQTTISAVQSKHEYDIEAKHAYGNKSETFMWPCFNCKNIEYVNESVKADCVNKEWELTTKTYSGELKACAILQNDTPDFVTHENSKDLVMTWDGSIPYYVATCKGETDRVILPKDMAIVIGSESILSPESFKNENIGMSDPVFTSPVIQDYMLNEQWNISQTAVAGEVAWVSCKDTKLIDGAPTNVCITDNFCGIASAYTAIEIKRGLTKKYMRPWAVTPNVLALNCTGLNTLYQKKAYHGFDGYGYRLVKWVGAAGMNKEFYTWFYNFVVNDRFKRSNKLPPNQFLGNFKSSPVTAIDAINDEFVFSLVTQPTNNKGLEAGTVGEDKDVQRYSIPIFTEFVNSLPAAVKAYSTYNLAVIDGITSLCTDLRNTQSAYKTPVSVDFTINDRIYRVTQDYINSVDTANGVEVVKQLVPTLGMTFLGSTPKEAYFYNQATRQYYFYAGGSDLVVVDMLERFRDIIEGKWDFINQEVLMPCLATFDRLDTYVEDDEDETDNIIIPALKGRKFIGEVTPPGNTIFNDESWFKTISLPSGLAYQGPNRCIINRSVYSDYMIDDIKKNKGKWTKVPREIYHPFRVYKDNYTNVMTNVDPETSVSGWTHNPFLLVTAPLGVAEETDCKFEWDITFAWTVEMDKIYESNEYVVVNILAETMTPGGKVFARPTHIYLTKDLFTHSDNYGYYSFRYQSNNGIGNRERLHIWSDGYIAISSLQLEYKIITERRNVRLTQQIDVAHLKEM